MDLSVAEEQQLVGVMSSVLEAIGNTPLVELSRITRHLPGRIC
jgi:hypothetical protein